MSLPCHNQRSNRDLSDVLFAPRLPSFALLLVDTGMAIVYNVDVTPERNKDEFVVVVVVVVLEAFSGDQSIQSEREAAVGRRASRQLHDIVVGIAVVLSSESQQSLSVQSYSSNVPPFVAPYPRRTAAHSVLPCSSAKSKAVSP